MTHNSCRLYWRKGEALVHSDEARQLVLAAMRRIDTLSNQRWHFFRKLLNTYDFNSREIAVNRAFYKLWELLAPHKERLLAKSGCNTLHLAEAPGSFVQVVKTMSSSVHSVAVSKPPSSYAEVVQKGKAIPTFSPEVTSLPGTEFHYVDLMSRDKIAELVHQMYHIAPDGFDLVTGDGGFDEEERYDEKEVLHYKLILGEVVAILLTQKLQGSCILKVFDTFTVTIVHILHLLCCHYTSFTITKPSTSRPTNSERYIVCHGFTGIGTSNKEELLRLMDANIVNGMTLSQTVPVAFYALIETVADRLARDQATAIVTVLEYMQQKESSNAFIDKREFAMGKSKTFAEWKQRFGYG